MKEGGERAGEEEEDHHRDEEGAEPEKEASAPTAGCAVDSQLGRFLIVSLQIKAICPTNVLLMCRHQSQLPALVLTLGSGWG